MDNIYEYTLFLMDVEMFSRIIEINHIRKSAGILKRK